MASRKLDVFCEIFSLCLTLNLTNVGARLYDCGWTGLERVSNSSCDIQTPPFCRAMLHIINNLHTLKRGIWESQRRYVQAGVFELYCKLLFYFIQKLNIYFKLFNYNAEYILYSYVTSIIIDRIFIASNSFIFWYPSKICKLCLAYCFLSLSLIYYS